MRLWERSPKVPRSSQILANPLPKSIRKDSRDFGRGFARIRETLGEDSRGFVRIVGLWERIRGDSRDFGRDLQGFARLWERRESLRTRDFGRGFAGIRGTFGEARILANPLPKSCESLRILSKVSRILANPLPKSRESLRILSQSLANPCESSPKVSRILANPLPKSHESSPKVL